MFFVQNGRPTWAYIRYLREYLLSVSNWQIASLVYQKLTVIQVKKIMENNKKYSLLTSK